MEKKEQEKRKKSKYRKPRIQRAKRVVILGAGQVGRHIMKSLANEGYNVILIDESEESIHEVREIADVGTIVGNGCDPEVYFEIGLNENDLFLAVADSDETNLVSCRIARAFGCKTKIARVRKPFYKSYENTPIDDQFWRRLGVEVLFNQNELTIQEIEHIIENEGSIDTIFLRGSKLQLVGYRVKEKSLLCGRRLVGLRDVPVFENLLVAAVTTFTEPGGSAKKGNRSSRHAANLRENTIVPKGDYKIKEGDLLFVCGEKHHFKGIAELFDPNMIKGFKHIFIQGGSELAFQLADRLSKTYSRKAVYLLEKNKSKAKTAAEILSSKIHVLMIDAHNIEDLKDEGLDSNCIFIAASDNEDDNVLSSLLVKEETGARTISIVQNETYMHLIPYLDIDVAISPKLLLVDDVLKALRGSVYDIISAKDQDAEILEFVVQKKSPLAGKTLAEYKFPTDSIVVAISREADIIIPKGDTKIHVNDHLVIFSLKSSIKEVQKIFQI
ncbi:MAG: NAD-binding protein [Spirochaetia bacterium]|nr:NAD-binding protein [Spirochaetia bacterium]